MGGGTRRHEDMPTRRLSTLFSLPRDRCGPAAEIRISEIVAVGSVERLQSKEAAREKMERSIYIALTNQASGRFK